MGKKLFLVRHAKSDWSVPGEKDFDRPLNSRGLNDAPKMGAKLKEMGLQPDIIISSPAERAKATAYYIAEQFKIDTDRVELNEELYEASVRVILKVINSFPDQYKQIMVVSHNPDLTYIAEYLTKAEIGNIPTCGVVMIDFETDHWAEVSQGTGKMVNFIYPKMLFSDQE